MTLQTVRSEIHFYDIREEEKTNKKYSSTILLLSMVLFIHMTIFDRRSHEFQMKYPVRYATVYFITAYKIYIYVCYYTVSMNEKRNAFIFFCSLRSMFSLELCFVEFSSLGPLL